MNVEATLRRIDEEIVGHKQNIARSQVEIMRLQETRLVLMGIAEGDINAAEVAKMMQPMHLVGAHAKPVLIVRKEGAADAETAAQREKWRLQSQKKRDRKAAKARDYDHERELRNERKAAALEAGDAVRKSKPGRAPKAASASGIWRPKILETLTGDAEGMTRVQMGDYFGLPRGDKPRKAFSNALYYLQNSKQIVRGEDGHFTLAGGSRR